MAEFYEVYCISLILVFPLEMLRISITVTALRGDAQPRGWQSKFQQKTEVGLGWPSAQGCRGPLAWSVWQTSNSQSASGGHYVWGCLCVHARVSPQPQLYCLWRGWGVERSHQSQPSCPPQKPDQGAPTVSCPTSPQHTRTPSWAPASPPGFSVGSSPPAWSGLPRWWQEGAWEAGPPGPGGLLGLGQPSRALVGAGVGEQSRLSPALGPFSC